MVTKGKCTHLYKIDSYVPLNQGKYTPVQETERVAPFQSLEERYILLHFESEEGQ